MNSNIGKYSMNPFKERSELVSRKQFFFILARYIVSKQVKISDDLYYVSYEKVLDKATCIKSGLDYINELNTLNVDEHRGKTKSDIDFESISTGAGILSYARIYMAKAMLYVIQNAGTIYYTDTDSLVIDIKLPESMTDPKKLGLFKLEVEVKEGYFLAEKVYAIKPKN
ncbi:hypothetical protein K3495_g10292 [Podosphaera aphanis]|nr:hypothetical protein K3495_g10292 [Podosphaera aphanis]